MNETIVLDKDDRDLAAMIAHGKEMRREKGVSETREEFNTRQATQEWQRMRQARTAPWTYYIVIEYKAGAYHAHALSFPEVTAQGETVEAVKEKMVQALQAHFAGLRARDEAVPTREYKRVETVDVPFEDLPAQPAAAAEEKVPA